MEGEDARVAVADPALPEEVEKFIAFFRVHLKEGNVHQIQLVYEVSFHKLTERYYKSIPWPSVATIAPLVENDEIFLMFYRELYFRHIYARLSPTLQHRFESWDNYSNLFNYFLKGDSNVSLPLVWIWDIVDEFIYQFQSYSQFLGKSKSKTPEERQLLKANPKVWDVAAVFKTLSQLVAKNDNSRYLQSLKLGGGEDLKFDLSVYLGFFSLIGLARMELLIGNYSSVIQILEPLEATRKSLYPKAIAFHITYYYLLGFSYLMAQRFKDSIRVCNSAFQVVGRSREIQSRSAPYDNVLKTCDKMHALVAIAVSLFPHRLDENLENILREKFGDKLARMQQGHEPTYEELFTFGCPKFVTLNPSSHDENTDFHQETFKLQNKTFLGIVRQSSLISTLRSYLKLYTTIPVAKLATYLDMKEEDVCTHLISWKSKTQNPSSGELQFWISNDMIHIRAPKTVRRQADFFITQTSFMESILNDSSQFQTQRPQK